MAQYNGRAGKGAHRVTRELKRQEAEERNALTAPENRKAARLGPVDPNTGRRTERSVRRFQEANQPNA